MNLLLCLLPPRLPFHRPRLLIQHRRIPPLLIRDRIRAAAIPEVDDEVVHRNGDESIGIKGGDIVAIYLPRHRPLMIQAREAVGEMVVVVTGGNDLGHHRRLLPKKKVRVIAVNLQISQDHPLRRYQGAEERTVDARAAAIDHVPHQR